MIRNVGIVGLGALGILFGQKLSDALGKEQVYVFADKERIARYRKEGVYSNGQRCEFAYVESKGAPVVDLLIYATKYYSLEEAVRDTAGACGEDTIVISLLNGVSSETLIEKLLRPAHLLYCVAQGMDATREGNRLRYSKAGSLAFGEKNNEESESVQHLKELFQRAGIAYETPEDIVHKMWSKWMLNVGANQTCAAYAVGYSGIQKGGMYRKAFLAAMEEARAVANAEGIALTKEELQEWAALIDTLLPDGEPSMRQDTKAGRKTEVGLFGKLVCELGEKHRIKTPQNEMFCRMLS